MCRGARLVTRILRLGPISSKSATVGAASISRDITTRKRGEERLAYQALHDPLTNLPNRNLVRDRLQLALARTERARA